MKLKLGKRRNIYMGSVTAKVQYDESSEIKWIDGVIEDITDQKGRKTHCSKVKRGRSFSILRQTAYVLDKME
jgi:hypothetical protein